MMLSAGLCSPHVIRSVLLINQWESNSYFRDPELTNEKRNVRSLLSPAMNMFVIIIWLKTADPPEHEDSLLWDISVGLHNKEPSEGVVCSVDQARYNWDTDVAQPAWHWLEFKWEQTPDNIVRLTPHILTPGSSSQLSCLSLKYFLVLESFHHRRLLEDEMTF